MKKLLSCLILLAIILTTGLAQSKELEWTALTDVEIYRLYYYDEEMAVNVDITDKEQRKALWVKNFSNDVLKYELDNLNLDFNKKYFIFVTSVTTGDLIESEPSNIIEYTKSPGDITVLFPENEKPPITVVIPSGTVIKLIVDNE